MKEQKPCTVCTKYRCFSLLIHYVLLVLLLLLATPLVATTTVSATTTTSEPEQNHQAGEEADHNNIVDDDVVRHRRLSMDNARKEGEEKQPDVASNNEKKFIHDTLREHLPMFEPVDFQFISPTSFPKPTYRPTRQRQQKQQNNNNNKVMEIVPYLKPAFGGSHRPDQDAVFVFAAEYGINVYLLFLTTLRSTGYDGDVVLALSPLDAEDMEVRDYLEDDPHVIAYVIDITCFNAENEPVPSVKGGIRVCKCDNLYGEMEEATDEDGDNKSQKAVMPIPDPRYPRPVATTRYEIYWLWIQNYSNHSWILLIDARDTVFQSNPFLQVPREVDNVNRQDGVLLLFGENPEATRLGKSPKNRKWLNNAYGGQVKDALKDKPTICSGSTLGEVIALETYLRAMVNEADETQVKLMGADQGFHNYLYYSQKLVNAKTIRSIVVQDQGSGIVNTLGAMRTKKLEEWGNGKLIEMTTTEQTNNKNGKKITAVSDLKVLNWDGSPSPIVHQFDRHELLTKYWYETKTREYADAWRKKLAAKKKTVS